MKKVIQFLFAVLLVVIILIAIRFLIYYWVAPDLLHDGNILNLSFLTKYIPTATPVSQPWYYHQEPPVYYYYPTEVPTKVPTKVPTATPTEVMNIYPYYFYLDNVEYVILYEGGQPIRISPTDVPTPTLFVATATSVPTATKQVYPYYYSWQGIDYVVLYEGANPIRLSPTDTPMPTNTPVPTNTPMPTNTPVPTNTPMPTYTPIPTNTPYPTDVPVEIIDLPIQTGPSEEEKFQMLWNELARANVGNEVLPTYDLGKSYDFYSFIDVSDVNPLRLFEYLSNFFIDVVAHSFNFDFSYGNDLRATLYSAQSPSGRLRLTYDTDNTELMRNIMWNISDIESANQTMLNFLNEMTVLNNENTNERLFVCE